MGACSGGPIFLKLINSSGIIKDGEYIAKLFIKAIEDVDAKNGVQVITDNAGNMKLAGSIVEQNVSAHILDTMYFSLFESCFKKYVSTFRKINSL